MFKDVVVRNASNVDITFIYYLFGNRCVMMQLYPSFPSYFVNNFEEAMKAVCKQERCPTFPHGPLSFYWFWPYGKVEKERCFDSGVFEFARIFAETRKSRPEQWHYIHVSFPDEVYDIFQIYMFANHLQTMYQVPSTQPGMMIEWDLC